MKLMVVSIILAAFSDTPMEVSVEWVCVVCGFPVNAVHRPVENWSAPWSMNGMPTGEKVPKERVAPAPISAAPPNACIVPWTWGLLAKSMILWPSSWRLLFIASRLPITVPVGSV